MKYVGIFAVLVAAALCAREYSRLKKKHLYECRDFLAFVSHLRIQLGCFLRTPSELAASFLSEALESSGFLGALAEGRDFLGAFDEALPRLSLSGEEAEILRALFSSLSEGYRDELIRVIDATYARFEPICNALSQECPKSIKLASVLSVTGALGFLILVI